MTNVTAAINAAAITAASKYLRRSVEIVTQKVKEDNDNTELLEAINAVLGLPEDRNVFIMLAVGYPSGNTRTKVRKEVDKICSFNRYEG